MKAIPTQFWRSGEILSPTSIRRQMDGMVRDVDEASDLRYTYSQFIVPFMSLQNSDSSAVRSIYIKPPFACDVLSVELAVAGDDTAGGDCTFTLSATGITGWEDVTVVNGSQSAFERTRSVQRGSIANGQEVAFTLSGSTASWITNHAYAIVSIRTDRWGGQRTRQLVPPLLKSGVITDFTTVNAQWSNYYNDAEAQASNALDHRIIIVPCISKLAAASVASGTHRIQHTLPAMGAVLGTVDYGLVRAASDQVDFNVLDEAAASLGSAAQTLTGTGTGAGNHVRSQGHTLSDTQPDDPDTLASDYNVQALSSSGTSQVDLAYAVLYLR